METSNFTMAAIMRAINRFVTADGILIRTRTPQPRNNMGRHRIRTHAPGDGHWHMKYHRNRH